MWKIINLRITLYYLRMCSFLKCTPGGPAAQVNLLMILNLRVFRGAHGVYSLMMDGGCDVYSCIWGFLFPCSTLASV